MTRRIQDEAAATFDSLFLAGKGDAMPAIDALSLFYDFRELTPIGRRGDEMIRRLADRLVSVDLLDQAAELLQHQVDHRLQGAARAQVATRLAVDLPDEPQARPGACDAALDAHRRAVERAAQPAPAARGARAVRHRPPRRRARGHRQYRRAARRSGCAPTSCGRRKRWREAAEQIELLYGDRWRDWQPLNDTGARRHPARRDRLRAGEDTLGLDRFREQIRRQDGGGAGPPRLRGRDRAAKRQHGGVPRGRPQGRGRRYARRVPARHARALSDDRSLRAGECGLRVRPASARAGASGDDRRRYARPARPRVKWPLRCRSSAPGCPRPGSSRRPARRRSA